MKKVLFAAVAVLALASCKKEYTCECTVSSGSSSASSSVTFEKMKKKDAEDKCKQGTNSVATCTLK